MDNTSIQEFRERLVAMKAKQRMRQKEHDLVMAICEKAEALRTELDEAKAEIERLREALLPLAFLDSETPQEAWDLYRNDRFKDWLGFEEIEAARLALEGYSND